MERLHSWLEGRARLDSADHPESQKAHPLLDVLFPERLKFTQLEFVVEYNAVRWRLEKIADDKLDATIKGLGGAAFLKAVEKAPAGYAVALGLTGPGAAPLPSVKNPLVAVTAAIKDYVFRVAGSVEKKKAATATLVDELLAPYANLGKTGKKEAAKRPAVAPSGGTPTTR